MACHFPDRACISSGCRNGQEMRRSIATRSIKDRYLNRRLDQVRRRGGGMACKGKKTLCPSLPYCEYAPTYDAEWAGVSLRLLGLKLGAFARLYGRTHQHWARDSISPARSNPPSEKAPTCWWWWWMHDRCQSRSPGRSQGLGRMLG